MPLDAELSNPLLCHSGPRAGEVESGEDSLGTGTSRGFLLPASSPSANSAADWFRKLKVMVQIIGPGGFFRVSCFFVLQ